MKTYQCKLCWNKTIVNDNIVMVICPTCMSKMEIIKDPFEEVENE